MPAVNEHRIVCKVLSERDIKPLLDRNVDGSWFFNDQHREAAEFLLEHFDKYGNVPARATFASQFGSTYKVFSVTESMDYLLDAQADALRRAHTSDALFKVQDLLKGGTTDDAVKAWREALHTVDSFLPVPSRLVDSMADPEVDQRWEDYKTREATKGIIGMSTGFPTIDAATLGLQPGQLITILAQPKVGKTTVSLAIANHIYAIHEEPVMFVTLEMSVNEMTMRQDSLMAQVRFRDLQAGELDKPSRKRLQEYYDDVKAHRDWPFWFIDAADGTTVSSITARADDLAPGLIVVDGIYLLHDEQSGETNTWLAVTNITRSLKRLAASLQIPIIINSQALASKSKGVRITADSAGYSSSFAQDSDVVLGLERMPVPKGEDEIDYAYQRMLRVLVSRNTGMAEVELRFDYDTGLIEEQT